MLMPASAKSREKVLEKRCGRTQRRSAGVDRTGRELRRSEYRAAHPLTAIELERFKQGRFTAYNDRAAVPISKFEVRQTVEIGLVNVNTQESRTIIDQQVWT